ncbi:MAG: type II toxin-antitoxin system HicB family antitoxin [Acetobacteraceae bacterium]|nr:type II toxin-antitoxin system HicB family antitoxin [Acetobacteraceae bacterium]
MTAVRYPLLVEPLAIADGGGFVAIVPDLPGCMSDGATPEEAVVNVQDAIAAWIEAAIELGRAVPAPSAHLTLAAE